MLFRGGLVDSIVSGQERNSERGKKIYESIKRLNKNIDWLKKNYKKIAKEYDLEKVKDELRELADAGKRIAAEIRSLKNSVEKLASNPVISRLAGNDINQYVTPLCNELDSLSEKIEKIARDFSS